MLTKEGMKRVLAHPLWMLLAIPTLGLIYTLINQEPVQVWMLYTDLDDLIPFMKIFIIPYAIWMPFLYLTLIFFFFKDRPTYYRTLLAYVISVLICYAIYAIFQTTVPRAELEGNDLLSWLVQFVYTNDAPFNCFPSIHCLSSYLLFRAATQSKEIGSGTKIGIGIITWSIILSTVFVKQHVVMDVFAGIMLGHVIFAWAGRLLKSRSKAVHEEQRSYLSQ
ncbi:phosphatase PAP2 family protein [Paenibacillus sp. 1011MAR3C5]|uniref:phosphatase PAP2 family protein n=1 Tax=Paenibacillus sp. 1011MAR3C5 TaxID=1675787 RepID=UPI000E6CBBA0|nr:phosphatase PAP2 family protein [Paenibacillus sp. 1011MAR3C5]RJE87493.1 phosphatase PAP2 family protein [Paenibacillus sp. 1011MAR3C5]